MFLPVVSSPEIEVRPSSSSSFLDGFSFSEPSGASINFSESIPSISTPTSSESWETASGDWIESVSFSLTGAKVSWVHWIMCARNDFLWSTEVVNVL